MRRLVVAIFLASMLAVTRASASSALELVKIAHAHEIAHEDDIAIRRYMEALALDPGCLEAYAGLGDLRGRRGDLHEAERVYSVALEHFPQERSLRVARAHVRRALGATGLARNDLLVGAGDDVPALRLVAGWHGEDGQTPAQLAVWRHLGVVAEATGDVALLKEARTMIRALVILVGAADPAAARSSDPFRRTVSELARRGRF